MLSNNLLSLACLSPKRKAALDLPMIDKPAFQQTKPLKPLKLIRQKGGVFSLPPIGSADALTECSTADTTDSDQTKMIDRERDFENKMAALAIKKMKSLYPAQKVLNDKTMLFSVQEEDIEAVTINDKAYLKTFSRVYKKLRSMSIDRLVNKGAFFQSPKKLASMLRDIKAINTGEFIVM